MTQTIVLGRSRLSALRHFLAVPFIAVGRFLVLLAETNPKLRELERLGKISDEELARRGKTREGEIRRILGPSAYL